MSLASCRKLRFVAVLAIACVSIAGCDSKPAQRPGTAIVIGSIKYKSQPVKGGVLTFISQSNPDNIATCKIASDGNFAVADAPLGDAKVTVDTESGKHYLDDRYVQVPAKYWDAAKTDLKIKIEEGENKVELLLQ